MGKIEILSQALQKKSQDIINAMKLLAATKESLNDLRNNGWDSLLANGASNLVEVSRGLVETEKHENDNMLDKLIRLILTLLVSTATTERSFSGMKLCKNRLRNKMSDDFLVDNLLVYIEREIAEKFDSDSIIDDLKMLKGRRAEL
ncbi:uncharacterized protein [Rutidosis leptorrhynchoides]|uniref:uncharacterized protein n=1 Tax=Rutidosis leptorrhynchoides TaxID=125765 RepID=UPI003A9A0E59